MTGKVLITGASGVVGSAAISAFVDAGWDVISTSRRTPDLRPSGHVRHLALDLSDGAAVKDALAAHSGISHLVFAALSEAPGLIEGWSDPARMDINLAMLRNCLDPLIASDPLKHVSIMQGAKAYGLHLHPLVIPARERLPRDPHPNFYWLQEDYLIAAAARAGFAWTILRPPMIMGGAFGAAMNVAPVLGAYAALCKQEGKPFGFPGGPSYVSEALDARLLAKCLVWAARAQSAQNQHFNLTNGDVFEWRSIWPAIADALGIEAGPDAPRSLATYLPNQAPAWDTIVKQQRLRPISLDALLGESHFVTDFLFATGAAEPPPPAFLSTIKIRKAGFAGVCDSEEMFRFWLSDLIDRGLLPQRLGPPQPRL